MKKGIIILCMIMWGIWILPGCSTMEAIGKDIQRGGEAIEDAAVRRSRR